MCSISRLALRIAQHHLVRRVARLIAFSVAFVAISAHAQSARPAPAARTSEPLPAALAASPTVQRLLKTGVVTVGTEPDGMPFSYVTADRQIIGYSIDICNELIKLIEVDLKKSLRTIQVHVTARTRLDLIRRGRATMLCGSAADTERSLVDAGQSIPLFFSGPRLLVAAKSPVRDFHDLHGKRVAVVKGTNSVQLLAERVAAGTLRGATITEVASNEEATHMVLRGDSDAFVGLDVVLAAMRIKVDGAANMDIRGQTLKIVPVRIVLRKDDPEFKRYVDTHLAGLMMNGTTGRLYNKWFTQPIPPANANLALPMSPLLRDYFKWPTDFSVLESQVTK